MAKMFYEEEVTTELLKGQKIAVIGYGSQGHAHSLNLKDSGFSVCVGLYENSKSWSKAEAAGLEVKTVSEATKSSDIIMMLIPDEKQKMVYDEHVSPYLREGQSLVFAHGFNIHFNQIVPPKNVDVFMIAPKGPGHLVRRVFKENKGVPALFAVHQDFTGTAKEKALAYAKGIGAARAGVLETTFKEETESDLFGEQCVLCGGVTALIKTGYETLVEEGYQKEVAYFECLHELKLIVDLLYEGGFEKMRHSISDTAEYGDYRVGDRIVTSNTKLEMKKVLKEIQDGTFANEWLKENREGRKYFTQKREDEMKHDLVKTGKTLREMMSWIKED